MANFFAQFHDDPPEAAPAGDVTPSNYFSRFHPDGPPSTAAPQAVPGQNGAPTRVIMDMTPKKPDHGVVDAAARGVAQGVTANFGDEIRGLIEAGGANPDDPASVYKLISGALKYWGGDKDAKKRYDDAVARERELDKTAEEQHPVASTLGNVAGAVALPVGAGVGAATLPERIAIGSGVGAAVGGAAGVGEGQGATDSIAKGITGAGIGGLLGGAAPAVVEGAVQGARAVAQPIVNTIRGIRDPEGEAARRVALGIQRDIQTDPQAASRLTPQEFTQNVQSGGPATVMDLGGETTRALARSAANTSPEGRAVLNRAINDRFEGQSDRVTGWLNQNYNHPDAFQLEKAIREEGKKANGPAYQRVMAAHPVVNVPSEITDRPAVAQAMKDAVSLAKNYGEKLQGEPEVKTIISGPGYHIADDVPNSAKTSLRYWDYVKKALDARIEGAKRRGGIEDLNSKQKADFRGLVDARNALVDHLDFVAPEYAQARAGAAAYFGAEDALDAGRKILTSKMKNSEIASGLAKMTPGERKLAQDGFVSEYVSMLREQGDRRSVLNKIAQSPAARERIAMVLGKAKADELESVLRVEGVMDLARGAVQGNSTTARQLAELGLAGGAGLATNGDFSNLHPSALMSAALVYGAAKGHGKINEAVSRKVAELLTSNNPRILLRGIQMVAKNNQLFSALRRADQGLARAGANQAPVAPALQAIGISRADDQPDVPRPPGQ
jgi:hypothetical protein